MYTGKRDRRLNLRVPSDWFDKLNAKAARYGVSPTDVIIKLVGEWMDQEPSPPLVFAEGEAPAPRPRRRKAK
jgi:hypothetical protein